MNIEDLLFIINRSATLDERFEGKFIPIRNNEEEAVIESRLKKWQELATANNKEKFIKRLQWENYNLENIRPLLGSVNIVEQSYLPSWSKIIELYCDIFRDEVWSFDYNLEAFIKQEEKLPFEELFVPFIYIARQKILEKTKIANQLLSQEAASLLERTLLHKLISIASQTLFLEFSIFRSFHQSHLTTIFAQVSGNSLSNSIYDKFIHNLASDGLIKFFKKYAVLARLIGITIELWIEFITEFLQRLLQDWNLIKENLYQNQEPGIVSDLKIGVSDNHQGGKSVIIVAFSQSNKKLVYKPKNIESEQKYNEFLELLNLEKPPLNFNPLKVLNCYGYGWVEFAEHLPCKNQEEAKLYFQRSGILLCLIYLLEATDCHQENIIASGVYPQLIDVETLMHHQYRSEEDSNNPNAQTIAGQKIWKSVLRTLFLPQWIADYDGNSFDVSGLSVEATQGKTIKKSAKWNNINTDMMTIIQVNTKNEILSNQPFLENGNFLYAQEYIDDLILGFRQMYQFLLNKKEAFREKEVFSLFSHERVRFIFRPTRIYITLLNKLLKPEFMKDGIDRSIEIDVLSRAFINSTNKPLDWNVLKSEHQALEQLDIPFFIAYSNKTILELENNQSINNYFTMSSYDSVIDNFNNLSLKDLELQLQLIQSSFYASSARKKYNLSSNLSNIENNDSKLTNEELIEEVIKIAEVLKKTGIYAEDGSVTWLGMQFIPKTERYQFQVIDNSLYGGNAGIALFFAALARISGNNEYAKLSLASLKTIQEKIKKDSHRYAITQGMGGFQGISSIAYALHHVGLLLNNKELQNDAYQALVSITPELIAKDQEYDVMLGTAGTLLTLISVYRRQSNSDLLKLAILCGDHLLTQRATSSVGYKTWANNEGKMLTGFSHGATGIAYALISLYKINGEKCYMDAAKEAIAYEQSVFVPEKNNWLDFSKNNENNKSNVFGKAWCHGAPGIALGRLVGIPLIDDVQQTIDIALETTKNIGLTTVDHLCCGNLGRALILKESGFYLNREELISLSHQFVINVVVDSRKNGGNYSLFADLPRSVITPGFMQGISGIGYGLLMFADSQRILPSVLLLN